MALRDIKQNAAYQARKAWNNNVTLPNGQMLPNSTANSWTTNSNLQGGTTVRNNSITPIANSWVPVQGSGPNIGDMYNNYIQQYSTTNPALANAYKVAYNGYDDFTNTSNIINNLYSQLKNNTQNLYGWFIDVNNQLDKDITGKYQAALDQAYSQYGPNGQQTKLINDFYNNMGNQLSTQNAVDLWEINAQAMASGANAWAVRNARAWANINANNQYIQMKQAQIENMDNVYKTLNSYLESFNQNYANSKNTYVRDTYNQLVNAMQQIEQAQMNAQAELSQAQLEQKMADDLYAKEAERLASSTSSGSTWGWTMSSSIYSGTTPWGQKILNTNSDSKKNTVVKTGQTATYNGKKVDMYIDTATGQAYALVDGQLKKASFKSQASTSTPISNFVNNKTFGSTQIPTTTKTTINAAGHPVYKTQPNYIGAYITNQLNNPLR